MQFIYAEVVTGGKKPSMVWVQNSTQYKNLKEILKKEYNEEYF